MSSSGRLTGAGFATSALLAPWFVGCGGLLLLGGVAAQHGVRGMDPVRFGDFVIDDKGVRIGDWVQIDDDGVRVNEPIEIDDRGVRRIPRDAQGTSSEPAPDGGPDRDDPTAAARHTADVVRVWLDLQWVTRDSANYDLPDLMRFYPPRGRELVGQLPEEEREKARAGAYGAPLLRAPFVAELGKYKVDVVELDESGDRAWVTVTSDDRFVRFWMVLEDGSWFFEADPVEYGTGGTPSDRR